jgi:hypothetical protein
MSRAVWQLGQAVRECGIALERAGARLSTDYSFTEPRECCLCSFPPPDASTPSSSFLGHYQKCRRGDPPNPGACACVRGGNDVRSAPLLCRGRAEGPFGRSAPMPSGVARLPARQRRESRAPGQRRTAVAVPLSRLAIRHIAPASYWRWRPSGEPCAVTKTPAPGGGGGGNRSPESPGRRLRGRHSEALHTHA